MEQIDGMSEDDLVTTVEVEKEMRKVRSEQRSYFFGLGARQRNRFQETKK